MKSNLKRIIKRIVIGLLTSSFCLLGLIVYGLHLMTIEDRYGDLQNLYWNSKDGDLIVNKLNSDIAIVELDWHRIYVKKGTKLLHVEEWLDPENKNKYHVAIYRPENKVDKIENLNISEITSRSELITQIDVEY
jgi:hypothetical protein